MKNMDGLGKGKSPGGLQFLDYCYEICGFFFFCVGRWWVNTPPSIVNLFFVGCCFLTFTS